METTNKVGNKKNGVKNIIRYPLDPSSSLLNEDALKSIIYKNDLKKNWNMCRLENAAPIKQSPFGDFPKEFLKPKNNELTLINKEMHKDTSINLRYKKLQDNIDKFTAFTSLTKLNKEKPKISGAFKPRYITPSTFRLHYDRGDLPIMVNHEKGKTSIAWKGDFFKEDSETLFDFKYFLPVFVDGIREKTDPYRFLAIQGTFFLLEQVKDAIIKVIPDLIPPLKTALNTRDDEIIAVTLKVIQKLVLSSDLAGDVLVPFYRQLLPIFNLYKDKNNNTGDKFEYGQRKKLNIGDLVQETLEVMEQNGGDVRLLLY